MEAPTDSQQNQLPIDKRKPYPERDISASAWTKM